MRDSNQEMRFKNFLNFIVQCWDALEDQRGFHKDKLDRHERLGEALAHAGVAITITSITDIIAFGVGGTTVSQNLNFKIHTTQDTPARREDDGPKAKATNN